MDMRTELARERATLARADLDLVEGQARVDRQAALVVMLQGRGEDARDAERLLGLLGDTLEHWRDHRRLILQRISYLEARLAPP